MQVKKNGFDMVFIMFAAHSHARKLQKNVKNVVKSGVQMGSKRCRRGSRWRLGARGQKKGSQDPPQGVKQEPLGGPGTHFDDMLVLFGKPNGRSIMSKWTQASHQNLV